MRYKDKAVSALILLVQIRFCFPHRFYFSEQKLLLSPKVFSSVMCISSQKKKNFPPKDTHLVWRWREVQAAIQEVVTADAVAISLRGQLWTCESSCWVPCFHANIPSNNERVVQQILGQCTNPPTLLSCWHLKHPAEKKRMWLVNKLLLHFLFGEKEKVMDEWGKYWVVFWGCLWLSCKTWQMLSEIRSKSSLASCWFYFSINTILRQEGNRVLNTTWILTCQEGSVTFSLGTVPIKGMMRHND